MWTRWPFGPNRRRALQGFDDEIRDHIEVEVSVVSLLIAVVGQYAVVPVNMRQRVREFGVRIALGASSRQVLWAVLGEGFALTAIGLAAGVFGVTPTNPQTYAGAFVLLAVVALRHVACRRGPRLAWILYGLSGRTSRTA